MWKRCEPKQIYMSCCHLTASSLVFYFGDSRTPAQYILTFLACCLGHFSVLLHSVLSLDLTL